MSDTKYYIICLGNGDNFKNNSNNSIWAVNSRQVSFLNKVKKGHKLWFIQHNSKIIAVADFISKNKRVIGSNNNELGWDDKEDFCDIEIHFNNLYNLTNSNLFISQKYPNAICPHEHINWNVLASLAIEYEYISKYSIITRTM